MIITIDKDKYLLIYSNLNKQILEITNNIYWNATEEEPIAVDKVRFAKGDYVESDKDIEVNENLLKDISEQDSL